MASRIAKRPAATLSQPQRKSTPDKSDPGQWAILALLILAPLVTFAPVCWSDFTTWDDNLNVSRNPYLNPPSLEGVGHFWVTPHMALYIPVTYAVWGIVAATAHLDTPDASGISLNASIFHLANLLVHVAAVLAAYQLLLALTRRRWPACAGALLFALHPVQVESVAWVAGMKDVLCGMFSLLSLWQYLRYAQLSSTADEEPQPPARRWAHYGLATSLLILAMLSKPSAMTVPAAALVLDRWIVGRRWRAIAAALLPWAVLALACANVAHLVQPVPVPPDGGRVWVRPLLAGAAVAFYLYKLVVPVWFAVQYHYSPQVLLAGRWLYVAWIIPPVLAVALWLVRRRAPWLFVAAALFVIPILPVLGLVPFQFERYSLTADHYLYAAMIGPAVAVAFGLSMLHRRAALRVAIGVCVALLAVLGVRSDLQTLHWRDTQTLFEHELEVNPDSDAADNQLAQLALDDNHPAEAERLALNSIHSRPDQSEAYDLMGNVKVRQRHLDEAAVWFRETLDRDPINYAALTSLGALAAERYPQQAIDLFQKAIAIEPTYESAHLNLATAFAKTNRPRKAVDEAQIAVRLAPSDPKAHRTLGLLMLGTGRPDLAAKELREALRLNPDQPDIRHFLSSIAGQGQ